MNNNHEISTSRLCVTKGENERWDEIALIERHENPWSENEEKERTWIISSSSGIIDYYGWRGKHVSFAFGSGRILAVGWRPYQYFVWLKKSSRAPPVWKQRRGTAMVMMFFLVLNRKLTHLVDTSCRALPYLSREHHHFEMVLKVWQKSLQLSMRTNVDFPWFMCLLCRLCEAYKNNDKFFFRGTTGKSPRIQTNNHGDSLWYRGRDTIKVMVRHRYQPSPYCFFRSLNDYWYFSTMNLTVFKDDIPCTLH